MILGALLLAAVEATGVFGHSVMLSEANFDTDAESGNRVARLTLETLSSGGNVGDLYMNRDGGHAALRAQDFPGLTVVRLDPESHRKKLDQSYPDILFPYPTFGNASLAITHGPHPRSLSRAMLTCGPLLKRMASYYRSNQVWVFPSAFDTAPVGTNGDLFASISPYWMTTAGRSWSDLPYLRAALEASRSFRPETKAELVRRGLLSPTIQTLIRKSLKGVQTEADYLSAKAHPTALPPNGVDTNRLAAAARALSPGEIPPLVSVAVSLPKMDMDRKELLYATEHAWAFLLKDEDLSRRFLLTARGADEFAFVQTHGKDVAVHINRVTANAAEVTLSRAGFSPTNRVDIAVFGRSRGTDWGAPSYISFARTDSP